VALMMVAECGGEPEDQKWVFDAPMTGLISNKKAGACINVVGCQSGCFAPQCIKVVYDPCETRSGPAGGG
jgi:hypothetical protein